MRAGAVAITDALGAADRGERLIHRAEGTEEPLAFTPTVPRASYFPLRDPFHWP